MLDALLYLCPLPRSVFPLLLQLGELAQTAADALLDLPALEELDLVVAPCVAALDRDALRRLEVLGEALEAPLRLDAHVLGEIRLAEQPVRLPQRGLERVDAQRGLWCCTSRGGGGGGGVRPLGLVVLLRLAVCAAVAAVAIALAGAVGALGPTLVGERRTHVRLVAPALLLPILSTSSVRAAWALARGSVRGAGAVCRGLLALARSL